MVAREIVLDKDALLYEIENVVDKVSRSRLRDDNLEQSIQVQAGDTEQDRAITTQGVDDAVNAVVSRMSVYVKDVSGGKICLQFPDGWKECVFPDLVSSIKDYIINSGVFEWLRITLPQEAQGYKERADDSYSKIKSCVSARKAGSVYRPLQPF